MTSSVDGPWTEKQLQSASQSQTCTKQRSWSLCSGLLCAWSTAAFWIPVTALYLGISMRCTKNSKPVAGTGQQNMPNSSPRQCPTTCSTTNTSKGEQIGLWSSASSTISTWHLANHHFNHLHNFLQGKRFHNQQEAENVFREFDKSQSMDLYAIGINTLISHWQKCIGWNGPYFD